MTKSKNRENLEKRETILELKGIKKHFPGVKALDGVDLIMRKGTITSLMGENGAGKSTILKVIFGIHKRTAGTIYHKGKEVVFKGPKDALEKGVAMVHQELQQVLTTSVMDNIWLGRFPKIGPFVDKMKMKEDTQRIFDELEIDVDPSQPISDLSVSKRQMVEIAKAVSYDSEVLILDEPTSSLTEKEVKHLFKILRNLRDRGVSILFVSHKMSEIFQISDFVTVFRDGKYISSHPVGKTNIRQVIKDMVGRDLNDQFPKRFTPLKNAAELLKVEDLTAKHCHVEGINFELKEGEILGVAGLVGAGRTEMAEMLFGRRAKTNTSKMFLRGKPIENRNPKESMKNGFAMITEERKEDGIFGMLDIEFNTTIAQIDAYKNSAGLLNKRLLKQETKNMIEKFATKTPSQKTAIETLSGGNQQKILIARWLLRQPDVFIMDEPTRGIDVGAKYAIYELINELAGLKKGVIMISSEMAELMGVCNRIAVMSNGKLAGIVDAKSATQEKIMTLAAKYY